MYNIEVHMDDFLKMDVFFAVTTMFVVFGGILAVVAMFYIVRILKSLDGVMKNVHEESDDIRMDINILRQKVRDEGMKIKHIVDFCSNVASRNTSPKRKRSASGDVK